MIKANDGWDPQFKGGFLEDWMILREIKNKTTEPPTLSNAVYDRDKIIVLV